ncbi:DoxX family protein [Hyphomicrobium sp. B1]|jgi:putative oxidoreductase|uniref:DoxX family protein n=1 Tax=unclassified Hyphomicrobium TaxID=2619925 RepID=UPI0039C16648
MLSLSAFLLGLGRVLLGGFFVYAGVHHFFIMPPLTAMVAARGIPYPRLVLIVGSLFQIVAGALFVLNIFTAAAAFGLIVFTIAASVMLLNFWNMDEPMRQTAKTAWQTNAAIVGGLLIAAAYAV